MRGRPRSFDAQAGVAAAQALFAREGFDAVGVADLCRLLGVKPPSLYAAYGSKRGLFEQAIAHYGAVTGEAYAAAIAGAHDLASLRRAMLETALELYLRDGGQGCMVLSNLAATGDADLRAMLAGIVTDRRAAMTARARAIGATEAEAHETVAAISVAMMGLSAGVRSGMDAETLRAGLRQLL